MGQAGGLSGRPLFSYALHALRTLRPLLPPSIPIIGCGGITTGSDALAFARAGASLVQIYTVFGYRGVGTPRLLKDEMSEVLRGSNWMSQIGRDREGKAMGWDEARLKRESEVVKREAESLAELLRETDDEDDVRRLVREAEAALGKFGEMETSGSGGARDNLLGADVSEGEAARRMIEDDPTPAEDPPSHEHARTIEEAVELTPVGIDLRPIMVIEEVVPAVDEEEQWGRAARVGSRRIV